MVSVSRTGAGGIPNRRRTRRIVDAHAVAELEQLALDSLVSPVVIVPGHALDQRGHRVLDGRAPDAMWVCPFLGDQATMPAQDRARRDQSMYPQHRG